MSNTVIEVRNLYKYFPTPGGMLHAVDDVSFKMFLPAPRRNRMPVCAQCSAR